VEELGGEGRRGRGRGGGAIQCLASGRHRLSCTTETDILDTGRPNLHMPYSRVSFRMILNALATYSMTRSIAIARSLHQLSFLLIPTFVVLVPGEPLAMASNGYYTV